MELKISGYKADSMLLDFNFPFIVIFFLFWFNDAVVTVISVENERFILSNELFELSLEILGEISLFRGFLVNSYIKKKT